jgi:SH3 domain-containing YSC84-like protein 1
MKDMKMRKATLKAVTAVLGLFLVLTACVQSIPDRTEAESLVARARWTIESFERDPNDPAPLFRSELKNARGVLVFPSLFKGALVFGGEGGNGVLLARNEAGEWSYPAFYTMGSGSFGFQAGAQSSEVVLILRNQKAVEAVVYNQGKFGGDIQVTFGTLGAGVQGATTTNLGADIVGVARSVGLYAGFSLEGAMLVRRNDLAGAYYEPGATPAQIVFERRYSNPDADPLRRALALY